MKFRQLWYGNEMHGYLSCSLNWGPEWLPRSSAVKGFESGLITNHQRRDIMNLKGLTIAGIIAALLFFVNSTSLYAADINPPASVVKLIFIHHSTGGNWLADPNTDQPSGGLAPL